MSKKWQLAYIVLEKVEKMGRTFYVVRSNRFACYFTDGTIYLRPLVDALMKSDLHVLIVDAKGKEVKSNFELED